MDIDQEIMRHLEWIESVVALIGNEAASEEEIHRVSMHDHCELGRWLESDESDRYQSFPEFGKLQESHKAFHSMAGELILALQDEDEDKAVASQKKFISMSKQVIGYLGALRDHSAGDSGKVATEE